MFKRSLLTFVLFGTAAACSDAAVEPASTTAAPERVEETSLAYFAAHRAELKLRDGDLRGRLALKRRETDALGMTHARFQQTVKGVPVLGAEIAAHYDRDGHVAAVHSTMTEDLDLDVTPALTKEESRAVVAGAVPDAEELEKGELAITAGKLVWTWRARAVASATPAIWTIHVDAKTGEVLTRINTLNLDEATGKGVLGDEKKFEVSKQGTGFVMQGVVDGVTISTFDAQTQDIQPGTLVASTTLTQWDPAAVDAQFYASSVVKYYKDRHGRNSIDGVGGAIISSVHYLKNLQNAFWDGKQMAYGDGDGVITRAYSSSKDIVGHELSHGVTERTSNLGPLNQAGALNEAWSDIMGACFAHYVAPDPLKNWIHGIDKQISPVIAAPARYLADPAVVGDPAHMDDFLTDTLDNGEVHANANIVTHSMYLMTMGGVNSRSKVAVKYGIGWEKASMIWYRANTQYWLETETFEQAAQSVLQSAKDLALTTNEQNIVECGFKATGILKGACAELTDPAPAPAKPASTPPPTDDKTPPASDTTPAQTGDDDDEAPAKTSSATKKAKAAPAETGGCNASGVDAGSLPGEAVLLALVVAASIVSRRRARTAR